MSGEIRAQIDERLAELEGIEGREAEIRRNSLRAFRASKFPDQRSDKDE